MSDPVKKCFSCRSELLVLHFPEGGYCQPCVDKSRAWQEMRRKEHADEVARLKAHTYKRDVDGHCPDDGEVCEECCEHEFDPGEGYTCLNCGKEGYEDMACAAEAYSDSREDR